MGQKCSAIICELPLNRSAAHAGETDAPRISDQLRACVHYIVSSISPLSRYGEGNLSVYEGRESLPYAVSTSEICGSSC
jgi:hypothetical protein